jgi:hypothetical protein
LLDTFSDWVLVVLLAMAGAFPAKALFFNNRLTRSALRLTCRCWANFWASCRLLYVRGSCSIHDSKYSRSDSCHLGLSPRPDASHNPPNPDACQRRRVARTVCSQHSKTSAIAGAFHPWALRRIMCARSRVLWGTFRANHSSLNVRSSSVFSTTLTGAGILKS